MAFEVFSSYGAAGREEATLRASGYLFVSKALLQQIDAERVTAVVLLYDKETSRLGVLAAASIEHSEDQIRLVSAENSGIAVNIVPVLRRYKLPHPSKKVKLGVEIEDNKMLVIDMKPLIAQAARGLV